MSTQDISNDEIAPLVKALRRKVNYLSDRVEELEAEKEDLREELQMLKLENADAEGEE